MRDHSNDSTTGPVPPGAVGGKLASGPGKALVPPVANPGPLLTLERKSRMYHDLQGLDVPKTLAADLVNMLEGSGSEMHKFYAAWSVLQNRVVGPDALAGWLKERGYHIANPRRGSSL